MSKLPKTLEELGSYIEHSHRIRNIVDALLNAGCNHVIEEALEHIPSDDLVDIFDIIVNIIHVRNENTDEKTNIIAEHAKSH